MKLTEAEVRRLGLAVLCAIGTLLSAHQYYALLLLEDSLRSQAAVEASFDATVVAEAVVGDPSAVRAAIKSHADETSAMRQSVQKLAASGRVSQMVEGVVWIGLFVLSAASFRRKSPQYSQ